MKKYRSEPVSVWTEDELLDGKRVRCLVIILSTSGCSWWKETGGCSMCGYNAKASDRSITADGILRQFEQAWKSFDGQSMVKIYTSGSFLDDCEIPPDVRDNILKEVGKAKARLLFESRPEYVTKDSIDKCVEKCSDVELALGLESANDKILNHSIGKGFAFSDYESAAGIAKKAGVGIRTYLLLKPPFLTEQEAIDDTLSSIKKIAQYSRVISINPVNVQRHTKLEKMWKSWAYRPPWLWSVIEVLRRADKMESTLIASTAGAGSERGAHNCEECNDDIINAIGGFNLTQNPSKLDALECGCRRRWENILPVEKFSIAAADHEKFFVR